MTDTAGSMDRISWEKRSLVDQVTDVVRRSILDGRYRPGETISISELADSLGVSPTPVREALQRLSWDGIMLLRPARTAVVAPLAVEDLHEIYTLRRLVEVWAAARACSRLTTEDVDALRSALELFGGLSLGSEEFWARHGAFHRILLGQISPRVERIINEVSIACERYIRVAYATDAAEKGLDMQEAHAPLVEAAATRSAEAMRAALTEHLDVGERDLVGRVTEILAESGAAEPD